MQIRGIYPILERPDKLRVLLYLMQLHDACAMMMVVLGWRIHRLSSRTAAHQTPTIICIYWSAKSNWHVFWSSRIHSRFLLYRKKFYSVPNYLKYYLKIWTSNIKNLNLIKSFCFVYILSQTYPSVIDYGFIWQPTSVNR